VRKVDLGLDLVGLRTAGTRRLGRFSRLAEVRSHLLGFMVFQGTGVRLLLGNSGFGKDIENRLALDFQLSGQIVDSNLAHPPFLSSALSR